MAETTRPLLSDRDRDLGNYQPLSIVAIAAFAVTVVFTLMVLVMTVAGLMTRKPILEPVLILVDVVGLTLAVAARWQIRTSEGTRAGDKLVKWSIWLGIGFGCVYIAYYAGNVFAVRQQAGEFARGWLAYLENKDFAKAFFFTVQPSQRKNRTEADAVVLFSEAIAGIKNQELSRVFERAEPGEVVIEPQGVFEWKQGLDGLAVTLNYLVRSREGEFDVTVTAVGVETPDLDGRQWFIRTGTPFIKLRRLTEYGRFVYELHADSHKFMMDWLTGKLYLTAQFDMYLDTQPYTHKQRKEWGSEYFNDTVVIPALVAPGQLATGGGLPIASNLVAGLTMRVYTPAVVPELDEMYKNLFEFVDPPKSQTQVSQAQRDEIRPKMFRVSAMQAAMNAPVPDLIPNRIRSTPDAIRSELPLDLVLPLPLNYRSRGTMVVVCTDRALVDKFNELAKAPWDRSRTESPVIKESVLTNFKHDWRLEKIIINLERNKEDPRPGGRPPMGPPS
jgi:hypothetical protein